MKPPVFLPGEILTQRGRSDSSDPDESLLVAPQAELTRSLLFEVSPLDPVTYAGVSLGLVVAAVTASYVPALRAAAVDPVAALRAE